MPEPHTDFIFAVTAGNAGFVGCILVLLAYAILLSRLITGARRAPDRPGMLVIMAIVGGLMFQIFINIGMELGILPVIGVPLPLMSAGLASLIATFIAIGFAISVQLRRFVKLAMGSHSDRPVSRFCRLRLYFGLALPAGCFHLALQNAP